MVKPTENKEGDQTENGCDKFEKWKERIDAETIEEMKVLMLDSKKFLLRHLKRRYMRKILVRNMKNILLFVAQCIMYPNKHTLTHVSYTF